MCLFPGCLLVSPRKSVGFHSLIRETNPHVPNTPQQNGQGWLVRQSDFLNLDISSSSLAVNVGCCLNFLPEQHAGNKNIKHLWPSQYAAKPLQSCPTLCDPIDGSPPGSPVAGILQARVLEWVAISFSSAGK